MKVNKLCRYSDASHFTAPLSLVLCFQRAALGIQQCSSHSLVLKQPLRLMQQTSRTSGPRGPRSPPASTPTTPTQTQVPTTANSPQPGLGTDGRYAKSRTRLVFASWHLIVINRTLQIECNAACFAFCGAKYVFMENVS